jgi:hypothetical protein
MEPMKILMWALCIGAAWIVFANVTGAGDWFGGNRARKVNELEERVHKLELRIGELEKQKTA